MNKHILLVMKWLNDKDSVTQEELKDNATYATNADAYADATIATNADAYAAYYAADAATNAAAYAAADAADAAAYTAAYTEKWVTKYFERTCENKQDYIDALTVEPEPVFTQEMADNGVLPSVGMEFMWHQWASEELKLAKMLAISGGECWIEAGEASFIVGNLTDCKPLTPPITLIDGKAYQFDYDKYTALGFYKESDCCFYDTACFDEEIAFKVQCTNIQPLTVGKE